MADYYQNNYEYIRDELRHIDLLMQYHVLGIRGSWQRNSNEKIPGLYISDEEIDQIFVAPADQASERSSMEQKRRTILADMKDLLQRIEAKQKESRSRGIPLAALQLAEVFHLSPFEMQVLFICLAPELDLKYQKLYAYIQDDITKKAPLIDMVLNLLCSLFEERIYARSFFYQNAPLMKYNLLNFAEIPEPRDIPLLSRPLKINDRVLDYLLDLSEIDVRLTAFSKTVFPSVGLEGLIMTDKDRDLFSGIIQAFKARSPDMSDPVPDAASLQRAVYYFYGPDGCGKKTTAEALCKELGIPLLVTDIRKILLNEEQPFEKSVDLIFREGLLMPCAIYMEAFDLLLREEDKFLKYREYLLKTIGELSWLTFLSAQRVWAPENLPYPLIRIPFPVPSYELRKEIWKASLDSKIPLEGIGIDDLANKFQFTAGQIRNATAAAQNHALKKGLNRDSFTSEDIYLACREQSNQKLSSLAAKLNPKYTWQDIVLPRDQLALLKEITDHIRYRRIVYDDWGFDRKLSLGKGLNILFSGPSGTGKTMAAEIIARELSLDIYKIDLSLVVSKYIGETEKNIGKIFEEAATSNVILFFDEADALFGKRSEVRDSHDRYANIEIGYLLQKMEEHRGIVILATNLRKNMDDAFTRRMHFSVDFPFPDDDQRELIWRGIFPNDSPLSSDLDYKFLSERLRLAGGNIKNIAVTAAFYAAGQSSEICLGHIIRAVKREYQKMGKAFVKEDFRPYGELMKDMEN